MAAAFYRVRFGRSQPPPKGHIIAAEDSAPAAGCTGAIDDNDDNDDSLSL